MAYVASDTEAARNVPHARSIATMLAGKPSSTARLVRSQAAYVTRPKNPPESSARFQEASRTAGWMTKWTSPATKSA